MIQDSIVPLTYSKVLQSKTYTVFVLGNETKKFAIYTSAQVGENIQLFLSEKKTTRPSTHELLQSVLLGCDASVMQVVIYDVQDSVYFSKIFFEVPSQSQKKIIEIDARPSDCLILALMHNAPIYCTKETFEKTVQLEDI